MFKKCLGLILFISVQFALGAEPEIKVLIGSSLKNVSVSGKNISRYIWPKNSYQKFKGTRKINFNCDNKQRRILSLKPIKLAAITSSTKILTYKDERYNGKLHIQTSEKMSGCDVINELPLEVYLSTLLAKEMNANWPEEALKAQVVAARSYAYLKMEKQEVSKRKGYDVNYDIESSEWHQVSGSFLDATRKTIKVAYRTMGEVLTYSSGRVAPVFFHSKCGGKTLLPRQVWSNKVPGYRSVDCPFCHKHGRKEWSKKIKDADFKKALCRALEVYQGDKKSSIQNPLKLIRDAKSNNTVRFYNGDSFKVLKKSRLRSILGRETLPSNYFEIKKIGEQIELSGTGFGHGVGMCQFGAMELAKMGYSYKQILAHYFPDLKIKKIY